MKIKLTNMLVGVLAIGVLAGCNAGMQPEGPNADELKKKEAALAPEKQIEMVQNSPMPAAQKAAKVAELKAKYGIK